MIRIAYTYDGKEKVFETAQPQVMIGRRNRAVQIDLDLSADPAVSRLHARVWFEGGQLWIEDIGSSYGSRVDDGNIKGKGRVVLRGHERIRIGDTVLTQIACVASETPHKNVLPREEALSQGLQLGARDILDGFQPAQLAELDSLGVYLQYRDELVGADGTDLGFFFVVLRGQFVVSKPDPETGKLRVLASVGEGQCFGEMSFLMGGPATANVMATGATFCWAIPHARLREFIESRPGGTRLLLNIARLLARRLQEGDMKLVGISPSLSAFFGTQARLSQMKTIESPRAPDHAEMEIPDDVFDQFAREVLNLPKDQAVTETQREQVRAQIHNNQVDIVPWLEQAGHGRNLKVRLQFVEEAPVPRIALQAVAPVASARARPVVVQVPQTRAQIAPARPVVVRLPRSVWRKLANVASWVGLPILAAIGVLLWLPLDSREALAHSSGFQRLPLHGWLQRVLLRETSESSAVMVKTGNWFRLEVETTKAARIWATLELEEKPARPLPIAVRLVRKDTDAAVLDRTITVDAGASSCELCAGRLSRGTYLLECAGLEQTPSAGLAARVVVTVWR